VRRIKVLYDLVFFEAPAENLASEGVVTAEILVPLRMADKTRDAMNQTPIG
jgi:hypothetical protein